MAKAKKREDGRYQAGFRYDGKMYMVYAKNPQELALKKAEKLNQLKSGKMEYENPRLADYQVIFTNRRRDKVSGNTLRIQRGHFNRVKDLPIGPNGLPFGQMRMRDIKPRDLLAVQDQLKKNYNSGTVNDTLNHIKFIFSTAVKEEIIDKSPCVALEKLKKTEVSASDTIHRALTEEETKRFFATAKDTNNFYYNAFAVLIQTGLRMGELAALNEFSVDYNTKMLHVYATETRGEDGSYLIGQTTKTAAGIRDIPISDSLAYIENQKKLNREYFGKIIPSYLFPTSGGGMLTSTIMNLQIASVCELAGIKRFTCHSFRATFATRFIEQRPEDFKILSEILGHSDISITLNLYTHVMQDRKVKAMEGVHIAI